LLLFDLALLELHNYVVVEKAQQELIRRRDSEPERELFYDDMFNHFAQCVPEATKFSEITQNNGHYAVQGHSRSPILVPIESLYATSY